MFTMRKQSIKLAVGLLLMVFVIAACSNQPTPTVVETPTVGVPTGTATPVEPTPTPEPAAAIVNGERISLAFFEREVERYLLAQEAMAQSTTDVSLARQAVLNELIDQALLGQAARVAGETVSDAEVEARIVALSEEGDLAAWMAEWGYTEEEIFDILKSQLLAGIQRDTIIESVPEIVEQVELRQVFAYTPTGATNAIANLNAGTPFEEVAFLYEPETGGYLGWVPRGYLLVPAVEDAAFNLPVGEHSEIIESDIGYHIVLVLDRGDHPLTSDARLTLQRQALQDWLATQRENSTIEVLID
jgi:parvulin-like peptidyl-prolyl isomerase